jgi:hypothetical protein
MHRPHAYGRRVLVTVPVVVPVFRTDRVVLPLPDAVVDALAVFDADTLCDTVLVPQAEPERSGVEDCEALVLDVLLLLALALAPVGENVSEAVALPEPHALGVAVALPEPDAEAVGVRVDVVLALVVRVAVVEGVAAPVAEALAVPARTLAVALALLEPDALIVGV